MSPHVNVGHCKHLSNEVIDVEGQSAVSVLPEHRSNASNYSARAMTVVDNILQRGANLIQVWWCLHQQTQGRICVHYHRPQRLLDLVSN